MRAIKFATAFGRGFDYYTGFVFELHKSGGSNPLHAGGVSSPDPLVNLAVPSAATGVDLTPRGGVSLTGGTTTLQPGVYDYISISNTANVTFAPGVYILTPSGQLLGRIPIPEDLCTNLAFGGPGRKTLYVTAGKTVYKVPLALSGYALYPPRTG